ncbi:GntR family transcriptional regulator [Corynebacterium lizhenjunii]|uniref:GntR family transcriptional regulator n=1 Tax=Corynebacterium lizhenjunii TaxID=2709394 RepID=A0A7T0KEA8_9CORY|nr:GntR family transcriptional regulator [Corynebacterium lizhenjunii]QPK78685.1 GntR family transcriptional regulator [Corynebacterium lizhenjunii]
MTGNFRRKPTYLVISDNLRSKIESKELRPGDRFPTERELVDEYGVARMTVRHALEILQLEGLIDRRRGRTGGTFVRAIPPVVELTDLEGIYAQLAAKGAPIQARVLSLEKRAAPRHIAASMELEEGEQIWELQRIRLNDQTPISVSTHYMPVDIFPDLDSWTLNSVMSSNGVYKREVISPQLPTDAEQTHLLVGRLTPLLRLQRTVWDTSGRVTEYSLETLRPDAVTLTAVVGEPVALPPTID